MARMPVNLTFEKLTCTVKRTSNRTDKKILNSINGTFHSGKLIGLLGPSGAGKTSLLNILAGYMTAGVTGNIYINGITRNSADLKRISTYLGQDISVQPFLTVKESLIIAARLKLGYNNESAQNVVQRIVEILYLNDCLETRSENLSGGERKRLSIGLELISDPSVILLDEPTTGLDEVSMRMCVKFLKALSLQGKMIICSIHQPSDSALKLFDQLYFMDDGYCIYNGSTHRLVPFLSEVQLECPTTYNPADYILEISQANKENRQILIEHARKIVHEQNALNKNSNENILIMKKKPESLRRPNYWKQVQILLQRGFLQMTRNKFNVFMQCFHFTMCGLVIGAIFFNFGNDAKHLFHNFMFCIIILVYAIFSTGIAPALAYPSEFQLFKNEILNGWYSLNAYFTSLSVISLPIPIVMSFCFCALTYFLSCQPTEAERFLKFCLIMILTVIISESHGKAVAMCCPSMYGCLVAPGSLVPAVALSFYGFGYATELSKWIKIIMETSFVRHSLMGTMAALYNNREKIDCSDIYCHYSEPRVFLEDMGMIGSYEIQVFTLVAFIILYKCAIYFFIRIKIGLFIKPFFYIK